MTSNNKIAPNKQNLLGIQIEFRKKEYSLEKMLSYIEDPQGFFHIVSINPEIVVIAQKDELFKKILSEGDIQLPDGVGILLGSSILGISVQNRVPGVDFMKDMLKTCNKRRLRVLFLGGRTNLADGLAERYRKLYPSSTFKGIEGIKDIQNPTSQEEEKIFSIVADYKPQILFAAFGSPYQEKWLYRHKDHLEGVVCMGVGGGFDFVSGRVARAPQLVRYIGLEWLFRLIIEPWRWRRQLRLVEYLYLVLRQKISEGISIR